MQLHLSFTPRTINDIEYELKAPISTIIQIQTQKNLMTIVKHGEHITESEAWNKLEKYMAAEPDGTRKSMYDLYLEILEQLKEQGFLPPAVDIQKMKDGLAGKTTEPTQELQTPEANTLA